MICSFVNLAQSATVTASTAHATYVANNAREPQRRGKPWFTTAITDSWIRFDFGSTATIGLVGIVRANFEDVRVQGNATDVWTSPSYNELMEIGQNAFNFQRQLFFAPVAFAYRYMRVFIPAQTPIQFFAEDPADRFRIGGVWAGAAVQPPRKFSLDFDHTRDEPFALARQRYGAWEGKTQEGNPVVTLDIERAAVFTHATPYLDDDARDWLIDVDAQAWRRDFFALYEDLGNTEMGWVVRTVEGSATHAVDESLPGVVRRPWKLREVIGP